MPRTPIDVYRGLTQTRLGNEIKERIHTFVSPFSTIRFATEPLSAHLARFIGLISRLAAYLDSKFIVGTEELTISIDVLDLFASSTKWWHLDRREFGLVLRPRVRNPRESLREACSVSFSGATQSRISNATEKLVRFLEEQKVGNSDEQNRLATALESTWMLLASLICRSEGRTTVSEKDFERAYDTVRVLLFYTTLEDYRALVASRELASSPMLIKAAGVTFSPGFERNIDLSVAANLEQQQADSLPRLSTAKPSATRNILTNSLRLLAQIQGAKFDRTRVEDEDYEEFTIGSIEQLEEMGVPANDISDEASVIALFKRMKPTTGLSERIDLMIRRIERILVDSSGNRDFLLQNSRFTARLLSLILLVAIGTMTDTDPLSDADIKRGLILVNKLLCA